MITIVSLAWNKYDLTKTFLGRLKHYTDIPFQLIFTDNGSTEDIEGLVKSYFPTCDFIKKEKNVGCPATRNEAMKLAKGDITFWLDNDSLVESNWYKPFLKELEDNEVGITGPTGLVIKNPWELPFPFKPKETGYCDWFMGWIVAFRTSAYKPINDYNLPVNLDDVELALGIKCSGYKAKITGVVPARHLTSQTDRGWSTNDQEALSKFWDNWKDKKRVVTQPTSILEEWQ